MSKHYIDNNLAILPNSGTIFEISSYERRSKDDFDNRKTNLLENNRLDEKITIGNFEIIPNGPDNLFPQNLKDLLDKNNFFHSLLREKIDLLLTGGTQLYTEKVEGNKIIKTPVIDNEISDWLESWDFENYLNEQTTDFIYVENNASLLVANNAALLRGYEKQRKIVEVRYLPIEEMRMGAYNMAGKSEYYYQANWFMPNEIIQYPAYDRLNPFKNGQSVYFTKMPSFGTKYYGRPPFIGIADYLRLKNLIINWSIDNLKNASFKWHVESPFSYWDNVKQARKFTDAQLRDYEDKMMDMIDEFLHSATAENASKRFHTKFGIDPVSGKETGWKLTALSDNTEKNSKAYLDASQQIDESIIASAHLDPSLSNIQIKGKLSSGLDKLIAFNIHQLVSTPQPRRLILAPVNEAIKINWPQKRVKLGFPDTQLEYAQKAITNTKENNNDNQNN